MKALVHRLPFPLGTWILEHARAELNATNFTKINNFKSLANCIKTDGSALFALDQTSAIAVSGLVGG